MWVLLSPEVRVREPGAKMSTINERRTANTKRGARQAAPKADAVASEPPQSVASEGGTASPKLVDVSDVDGDAGRPDSHGDISPGKTHLDLCDGEVPSVATYAKHIRESWRRCLDEIMEVARLCAGANAQLTTAEKSELMLSLPFGEATFSKLVQIGNDARLQKPEIQRLLPPHYTTVYAVTLLKDEELSLAIAEKVISPDLKRVDLEKWCDARREQLNVGDASSPQKAATDSAVTSPPVVPTQDPIESAEGSATPSQHETQGKPAVEDGLATNRGHPDKESDQPTVEAGDDQSNVPDEAADQSARPGNNEGEFERFIARWEKYLATDWAAMAKETRARFVAEVLGHPERVK
jgi:hypothetical protein